jgi:hypothetical protein
MGSKGCKAADIIGLYLNPPQRAAVFCVDKTTAVQALDRLDPVLPLSPGRAERDGFESCRHGTLSLRGLECKTGIVEGKTARRHTSAELIEFLSGLVNKAKWAREIHIVLDNLSAHKTPAVEQLLAEHTKVRFHLTPTYSSWAKSGGAVVCQNRAGRDRTRGLHFGRGSAAQINEIHPRLHQTRAPDPLDLYRCEKTDCQQANQRDSPLELDAARE